MKPNGHRSNLAARNLGALGEQISSRAKKAGYCRVSHAADLKVLESLSREALEEFARDHGLIVVARMAGEEFEFTRRWDNNLQL